MMDYPIDKILENSHLVKEAILLICDQHLGYGSTRDVWGSTLLPDVVFKFEARPHSFANISEYGLWDEFRNYPEHNKWLAPVLGISPCGTVLAMKRCDPLNLNFLPKQVPVWATDMKAENWGMMEDKENGYRAVMIDYHITFFPANKRMKAPDW